MVLLPWHFIGCESFILLIVSPLLNDDSSFLKEVENAEKLFGNLQMRRRQRLKFGAQWESQCLNSQGGF